MKKKIDSLILNLRVILRASKDLIQEIHGDALKTRTQAPPIEGKANTHLVKFLAKQWDIPQRHFKIISGETGRNKRIRILSPSPELRKTLLSIAGG